MARLFTLLLSATSNRIETAQVARATTVTEDNTFSSREISGYLSVSYKSSVKQKNFWLQLNSYRSSYDR